MRKTCAFALLASNCHAFGPSAYPAARPERTRSSADTGHGRSLASSWVVAGQGRCSRRGMQLQHQHTDQAHSETAVALEHRDVPVAHAGLHDFLYGDAEDHGAAAQAQRDAESFDGQTLYSVPEWLKQHRDSRHAAVYAVVGADGRTNYVGVSRNVALSLAAHEMNEGAAAVDRLRVRSFKYPKRAEMDSLKQAWISELGYTPVGNGEQGGWSSSASQAQHAMTEDQREAYEASRLKMRKAIADTTLIDELPEMSSEDIERRRRLELAVTGDDWSSVIDAQTQATVTISPDQPLMTEAEMFPEPQIISPFDARGAEVAAAPQTPKPAQCNNLEFNKENVDKVLDEVRPYLISDGGNVMVAAVDPETRSVSLVLQGACGSCPSSTQTMKMGIERVLKENFAHLGEVKQVNDPFGGPGLADLTTDIVEAILDPIRPAIKAMRGHVEVVNADDGVVTLKYKGSPKIAYGIELSLRDNPMIRDVKFV